MKYLLLIAATLIVGCSADPLAESIEVSDVLIDVVAEEDTCVDHGSVKIKSSTAKSPTRRSNAAEQIHSDLTVGWSSLTQQKIERLAFLDEINHRNGPLVNLFAPGERYTSPFRAVEVTDSQTFVAAFIQEAYDWGIDIRDDYNTLLSIPYAITLATSYSDRVAVGSAYQVDNRNKIQIILNRTYYNDLDFPGGMKVMWHELGHDVLDLAHAPDGIMNSYYGLTLERFVELKRLFWSHYVWAAYTNFTESSRNILRDPVFPGSPNYHNKWRPNYLKPLNVVTEVGPNWIKVSGDTDSFGPGGLAMYEIPAWGTPSSGHISHIVGDKIYIRGSIRSDRRVAVKPFEKMASSMAIPPQGMPRVGQKILLTKNRY